MYEQNGISDGQRSCYLRDMNWIISTDTGLTQSLYWYYIHVPGRYYLIHNKDASWLHTPMTQQLTHTTVSVTTVMPTFFTYESNGKWK